MWDPLGLCGGAALVIILVFALAMDAAKKKNYKVYRCGLGHELNSCTQPCQECDYLQEIS